MARKVLSYGVLSDHEQDANGYTFFGSGNTADGWHGRQSVTEPTAFQKFLHTFYGVPLPEPVVEGAVGLKVHYRTGEDAAPTDAGGDKYNVDGGYQQDGVHGASGTRTDRASWNVDYSIYDQTAEFENAQILVDINPTAAKEWLTFNYDAGNDVFVAVDKNGNLRFLETGNGPDTVKQDSINLAFFSDLIDNDGNAANGFQAWDMEHGQFDFQIRSLSDHDGMLNTGVTVNVGEMFEVA